MYTYPTTNIPTLYFYNLFSYHSLNYYSWLPQDTSYYIQQTHMLNHHHNFKINLLYQRITHAFTLNYYSIHTLPYPHLKETMYFRISK